MIDSPWPVHDTATVASSAHVPAPISGESPTRPSRWPDTPPVDVAAARRPSASRATAPTVPRAPAASPSLSASSASRSRSVTNHVSFSKASPAVAANSIAGGADEQHVAALGEHRARRADRVAHAAHGRHRAGGARGAVHDRRVELDAAVLGQRGAAPGVELGVVLEHDDGGLDGVERRSPPSASTACPASTAAAAPARMRPARSGSSIDPPAPPWTTIAISSIARGPYARRPSQASHPGTRASSR